MSTPSHPNFIPVVVSSPYQQQPERNQDTPPVRIVTAIIFLKHLTEKTTPQIGANDINIEQFPGQDLTKNEVKAQDIALQTLSDYFLGHLDPDPHERIDEEERRLLVEERKGETMIISCPNRYCSESIPDPKCQLCRGSGVCKISPASKRLQGGEK